MFNDGASEKGPEEVSGLVEPSGRALPFSRSATSSWDVPRWLDQVAAWIWRLALVGLAIWAVLRVFGMFRLVTVPILFALILTALFWPLRQRLVSWGLPELLASWAVLALAIGSLGGITWLAVVGVGEQLDGSSNWTETQAEVEDWLMTGPLELSQEELDGYEEQIGDALTSGAATFGASGARTATEVLGSVLLTAVLVFFFIKDGPDLWAFVVSRVKPTRQHAVSAAGDEAFGSLTGYARGVAFTGAVDGVLIGAVLLVLGVPLAVPLALLTFFAAFIPIVGASVVGLLSVVVALVSVGVREAIIVGVATLVIQQVEGDVVLPLVMGTQVRLHPAVILTVLAAGGAVAGLIGALVAVPLTAMASAAMRGFREAQHRSALTTPVDVSPD